MPIQYYCRVSDYCGNQALSHRLGRDNVHSGSLGLAISSFHSRPVILSPEGISKEAGAAVTGKIITVAQQKGGSGKTTVAAHLAVAFHSLLDRRVAILDTDPQGSLGRWFMARTDRSDGTDPDMEFRTASAWGARFEAQRLAKDNDIVVVDTPPKMGIDGRPAIETADLVIVPVAPSPVDLWATEPTLELARGEKKPILMVLNKVNARARLTGEIMAELDKLETTCAETTIGNRVAFAACMGDGRTVLEAPSSRVAAREIGDLTHEIADVLETG